MWIDTRDRNPDRDGEYFIQWVSDGSLGIMNYTPERGWNTHRDKDGRLNDTCMIEDYCIARWYDIPQPESVPEAWVKEWEEQI